jgi:hypothetical protein
MFWQVQNGGEDRPPTPSTFEEASETLGTEVKVAKERAVQGLGLTDDRMVIL